MMLAAIPGQVLGACPYSRIPAHTPECLFDLPDRPKRVRAYPGQVLLAPFMLASREPGSGRLRLDPARTLRRATAAGTGRSPGLWPWHGIRSPA